MMATHKGGDGGDLPPEVWNDAFERQLRQPDFTDSLHRYARGRARLVARYRRLDDGYAWDLVQDAIADTLEGTLAWDPRRVDLKKHLRDSIKSRSRHDYRHAKRYPCVDVTRATVLAELADLESERAELRRIARSNLDALRELAAGDPEVLLLIAAHEQHARKKIDVLQATGLTPDQYHAARARLRRLRERFPDPSNEH